MTFELLPSSAVVGAAGVSGTVAAIMLKALEYEDRPTWLRAATLNL